MTNWIKDCFWSWANAIYFRFDKYEYDMDRCAFFEELNSGWHQMQDEWAMSQPDFDPWNLSGRDPYYSYVMSQK
jgi:hypothetical protein